MSVLNRSKSRENIHIQKTKTQHSTSTTRVSAIRFSVSTYRATCLFVDMSITLVFQALKLFMQLRLYRLHGMSLECIYTVYRGIFIAKLTYASSVWWGFTAAADRQRLEAVIRMSHSLRNVWSWPVILGWIRGSRRRQSVLSSHVQW